MITLSRTGTIAAVDTTAAKKENFSRRKFLHLAAGAAALPAMPRIARAQGYPTRSITMVVPFAAGGPTDVVGRIVTEHMSQTLGQRFVVENVAGAGGTTGTLRGMRATPDGYTIQMGQMGTHVAALAYYSNLAYKPDEDFSPIGLVADNDVWIVANKNNPAADLQGFIANAKAKRDMLNSAHAGVGSVAHFSCVFFNSLADLKPAQVPFNSAALAMNAIVAGHVDYGCGTSADVIPQAHGGTIKVFAVGSEKRSPALPNVPTAKEAGLSGFHAAPWFALFGPRNIPTQVLNRLTDALDKALDNENVQKRLLDLGCIVTEKSQRGPQALSARIRSEIAQWVPALKVAS
jgi:tripartite-type tricarboxylate transporter receptor subunit TctC